MPLTWNVRKRCLAFTAHDSNEGCWPNQQFVPHLLIFTPPAHCSQALCHASFRQGRSNTVMLPQELVRSQEAPPPSHFPLPYHTSHQDPRNSPKRPKDLGIQDGPPARYSRVINERHLAGRMCCSKLSSKNHLRYSTEVLSVDAARPRQNAPAVLS